MAHTQRDLERENEELRRVNRALARQLRAGGGQVNFISAPILPGGESPALAFTKTSIQEAYLTGVGHGIELIVEDFRTRLKPILDAIAAVDRITGIIVGSALAPTMPPRAVVDEQARELARRLLDLKHIYDAAGGDGAYMTITPPDASLALRIYHLAADYAKGEDPGGARLRGFLSSQNAVFRQFVEWSAESRPGPALDPVREWVGTQALATRETLRSQGKPAQWALVQSAMIQGLRAKEHRGDLVYPEKEALLLLRAESQRAGDERTAYIRGAAHSVQKRVFPSNP